MSVQTDLEKRTAKLQGILDETNEALAEKNAAEADNLAGIPAAVRAIEMKQDLQLEDVYIEPSDETQVVEPSKGYDGIGSVTVGATNIPNTVAIDYSNYSSGTFIETLDTGEELEYTLTLDSEGKPISITTPSGDAVTVEWQV